MEIKYTLDGVDFKNYGVYVSSSQGLIGGLKPKKGLEVEWPDESGSQVDVSQMHFEGRSITLNCFALAEDAGQFIGRIEAFTALFYAVGEHVLKVMAGEKALEYKVRLDDMISVEKKFREGRMVATFTLKLYEYEPSIPKVIVEPPTAEGAV